MRRASRAWVIGRALLRVVSYMHLTYTCAYIRMVKGTPRCQQTRASTDNLGVNV